MQKDILQSVRRKGGKVKEKDERMGIKVQFFQLGGMYHKGSKI